VQKLRQLGDVSGDPPDATYVFKHSLVQDSAYSTLLRQSRRALHAHIALGFGSLAIAAQHLQQHEQPAQADDWSHYAQFPPSEVARFSPTLLASWYATGHNMRATSR
jgi:hypothetical protein